MTEYPSADEYMKAVQQPDKVFARPELQRAKFALHPTIQLPMPATGTSAAVFKATVGGTEQALRFFTREDASTRERYTALNEYFMQRGLSDLVATCSWVDDAIKVKGRRWPVVRMEWVEGMTLDEHVAELVEEGDTAALGTLAGSWREVVRRMQAARFAHGDLQHGNVLVDEAGRLRLVDFDCAWIEPFTGKTAPAEAGQRNYQHPGRTWGPWMDTFPGLVVYTSLLALSKNPSLWWTLHNGENLLFQREDFHQDLRPTNPTDVWWQMASLRDPQLDLLTNQLRMCCAPTWSADRDMERLIGEVPWWMRTQAGRPGQQPPPRIPRQRPPTDQRVWVGTQPGQVWTHGPGRPPGPVPGGVRPGGPPPTGGRPGQTGWWEPPAPGGAVKPPDPQSWEESWRREPEPGKQKPAARRVVGSVLVAVVAGVALGVVVFASAGARSYDVGGAVASGIFVAVVLALLLIFARRSPP